MNISTIQRSIAFNRSMLSEYHGHLTTFKMYERKMYEKSDRDTDEGQKAFTALNFYRDGVRYYKKKIQCLESIQRELIQELKRQYDNARDSKPYTSGE